MIKKILSFWYIFKSMILMGYVLDTVLRKFYVHENPYKIILFHQKIFKRYPFFKEEVSAVKTATSVSYKKSFYVDININSTSCRFFTVVGVAWFSEKMAMNAKFRFPNLENPFENSTLIQSERHRYEEFVPLRRIILWENYAKCAISSEYGHKIISKLSIRKEFYQQVDEWINNNLQGDWVGVHFRGGDWLRCCMETYITHLSTMIDKGCKIFACSDQIQFIDQMKEMFPGRVFFRDITRSYNHESLHRDPNKTHQQQLDALIDILILSRTKLIYSAGSWFVDVVRFFNPAVKIISFDSGRRRFNYHKEFDNFIIPPQNILLPQYR